MKPENETTVSPMAKLISNSRSETYKSEKSLPYYFLPQITDSVTVRITGKIKVISELIDHPLISVPAARNCNKLAGVRFLLSNARFNLCMSS